MGNEINLFWPLRYLRRLAFVFLIGVISSCASVKKTAQTTSSETSHVDNSVIKNDKTEQIVIEEKGTVPILTKPDTAGLKGWFSVFDSTGFSQETETNGQKLKTTIKPVKDKNGKTTGYDVNTQSVKKSETILAPVNKKTTINTSDKSEAKNDIVDTKKEKSKTTNKTAFRFNFAGTLAIVGIIAAILIFLYFVLKKRITK